MEKLNIAELLKDCPKGMELDCVMYDNVSFDKVSDDKESGYPIFCYITDEKGNRIGISFTENGHESKRYGAKCVIFPKGKTTWEGFQRPFKDGDVVTDIEGAIIIYKGITTSGYCGSFVSLDRNNQFIPHCISYLNSIRFATEEEKQKLFDAIKANGYRWNAETKTLEKLVEPKFKVGDRIRHKTTNKNDIYEISKVYDDSYGLVDFTWMVYMKYQDDYELVPNKFDITSLKPFESRILVRSSNDDKWRPAIFGFTYSDKYYIVGGFYWEQCIPYESNKHLLGTTDDCDDYYKTWE